MIYKPYDGSKVFDGLVYAKLVDSDGVVLEEGQAPSDKLLEVVASLKEGQSILIGEEEVAEEGVTEEEESYAEIKRHHAPRAEVFALWNAALAQYPALAQDELAGTTAEQTLDDALNYLEGEGAVLQSHMSAILHLNPPWLAETVRLGSQSQKQTRGRTDAKRQTPTPKPHIKQAPQSS